MFSQKYAVAVGERDRYLVVHDEVFSSSTTATAFVEETELFLCRFFQRLVYWLHPTVTFNMFLCVFYQLKVKSRPLVKFQGKNAVFWHFPGVPVVKNPLCNAGDTGSIPGWVTKIPHTAEQPRQSATSIESACSGARTPQLENLSATTKDPSRYSEDSGCCN